MLKPSKSPFRGTATPRTTTWCRSRFRHSCAAAPLPFATSSDASATPFGNHGVVAVACFGTFSSRGIAVASFGTLAPRGFFARRSIGFWSIGFFARRSAHFEHPGHTETLAARANVSSREREHIMHRHT